MNKHVAETRERSDYPWQLSANTREWSRSDAAYLYRETEPERVDQDLVRQLIRRKLRERRLPQGRASSIWAAVGQGQACDACGEPIVLRRDAVWAVAWQDWMSLHFHPDCYELWNLERLALARQDGGGRDNSPTPESDLR